MVWASILRNETQKRICSNEQILTKNEVTRRAKWKTRCTFIFENWMNMRSLSLSFVDRIKFKMIGFRVVLSCTLAHSPNTHIKHQTPTLCLTSIRISLDTSKYIQKENRIEIVIFSFTQNETQLNAILITTNTIQMFFLDDIQMIVK